MYLSFPLTSYIAIRSVVEIKLLCPCRFSTMKFTYNFLFFSDVDDGFKNTKQVFEELCIDNFNEEDCRIAQYVCSLVSTRAAYLASAG